MNILLAILVFGGLIFVHELGHYLAARACGIGIREFSVGMGPRILGWTSKKTGIAYNLRLLPIGGFVSMYGEDEDCEREDAFHRKPVWQRLIVTVAGAVMNILVGLLLTFVMLCSQDLLGTTTIVRFQNPYAASELAGLCAGDEILSFNGAAVTDAETLEDLVGEASAPITLTVRRGDKTVTIEGIDLDGELDFSLETGTMVVSDFLRSEPRSKQQGLRVGDEILYVGSARVHTYLSAGYEIMRRGIEPIDLTVLRDGERITIEDVSFVTTEEDGVAYGNVDFYFLGVEKTLPKLLYQTWHQSISSIKMVWESLTDLVTGRYGLQQMSGPVGTTQAIGQAAQEGNTSLLYLCALIAMNLGVFNLLPFPALDGGRILFLLIEFVRRKPMRREIESYINMAGLFLLLLLMAVVTFKDIIGLFIS